ncbi:carbohydrate ABC transporter permease [Jiangella anatolica]|uniref:carbohydrate ABC transporter permease n=1 Tax=Jiangella anatolica TaxID=2670374 RepID=UPI001314A2D0|nr:carbohydrate ABC transporter permease [Jiangella anatolica]
MATTIEGLAPTVAPTPAPVRPRRRSERFTIGSTIVVVIYALCCLVPFWVIIASSLTDESEVSRTGYSFFPSDFSLEAYAQIFGGSSFVINAYVASVFITVIGTALALSATSGLAWVISRRESRFSRPLAFYTYIPLLLSGGLVPLYILVTQYLQLRNTWWAVILPLAVSPFLVFVQMQFFREIPQALIDSARIDGANELRIFFTIVLPISKPILAVIGLFYGVTYWNEWFTALLFISDKELQPLQQVLQMMIGNVSAAQAIQPAAEASAPIYQLRMALTVVTMGPILLAYPFAQRYFVKGLTLGATKG